MNIFALDIDPVKAAEYHCDRHVVKMILEYSQLLSTAHYMLDGAPLAKARVPLRPTHTHHPCAVWARHSDRNYQWLHQLLVAVHDQFQARYGHEHSYHQLHHIGRLAVLPFNITMGSLTPFPQCMPEQYKGFDHVKAYRAYYMGDKHAFATWRDPAPVPYWWKLPAVAAKTGRVSGTVPHAANKPKAARA